MMRGPDDTALVPTSKDSPIPSRNEVIKDLIKYFAQNFGIDLVYDAAERLFRGIDTMDLYRRYQAATSNKTSGGSGFVFVALGLLLLAGKRKRGRR